MPRFVEFGEVLTSSGYDFISSLDSGGGKSSDSESITYFETILLFLRLAQRAAGLAQDMKVSSHSWMSRSNPPAGGLPTLKSTKE